MKDIGRIGALVLAFAGNGAAQDEPLPVVWEQIHEEAQKVIHDAEVFDSNKTVEAWYEATARRLASARDRATSETMIRTIDQIDEPLTCLLGVSVIIDQVDPRDEHQLKSIRARWAPRWTERNWRYFAIVATDAHRDDRSRDFFLECLREDVDRDDDSESREIWSPFECAAGFLRSYVPGKARPELVRFLASATKIAEAAPGSPLARRQNQRASWLRGAVSSLDYAASLDSPVDRRRYQDFERRLWRARAIGPMWPHLEWFEYLVAARLLEEDWREGDGQFVLRIFEDPASTAEETRIGAYLAHRISPDGMKRLRAIADGESPKAEAARNALKEAAHRMKRDREEPNAPMFDEDDGPFY